MEIENPSAQLLGSNTELSIGKGRAHVMLTMNDYDNNNDRIDNDWDGNYGCASPITKTQFFIGTVAERLDVIRRTASKSVSDEMVQDVVGWMYEWKVNVFQIYIGSISIPHQCNYFKHIFVVISIIIILFPFI